MRSVTFTADTFIHGNFDSGILHIVWAVTLPTPYGCRTESQWDLLVGFPVHRHQVLLCRHLKYPAWTAYVAHGVMIICGVRAIHRPPHEVNHMYHTPVPSITSSPILQP